MSGAKEIRTKIKSIESTQKITKAMEMVAASKMRKAQDRMTMSRPYADRIKEVIKHISNASLDYEHPYTIARPVKRVGFIIISSDRGLCGGLNINLFKKAVNIMSEYNKKNIEIDVAAIGSKGFNFCARYGMNILAHAKDLGDAPTVKDLIGVIKVMLDAYDKEQIDELWLVNNKFVNTMSQDPVATKLLPIEPQKTSDVPEKSWDYIYEPKPEPLLNSLLERYVESLVYQAVVENVACEQAARMVAMKSATDNAGDLIKEFKLLYNKVRQASITQELSEIVAGAAAV